MSSFFQDILSLGFFSFAMKKKLMKGPRNIEMEVGIRGAGQTFNHKCPN
jgi:hypothetical protein